MSNKNKIKETNTQKPEKYIALPKKLTDRIIKAAELKSRCKGSEDSLNMAHREWDNGGYSVYSDRG